MKYRLLLVLIAWFSCTPISYADPLITFSFKSYTMLEPDKQEFVIPKTNTFNKLERIFSPIVSGITVSYGGFITVSDLHGLVSFPRLHEKPIIPLLITPRVTPILMGGLTIHHWEREIGTPAALYLIERKEDAKTKKIAWYIHQEALPKSAVIKPSTIIIFADPASLVIPTGEFPTSIHPNLHLPDLYVKNEILINQRALYVLNIKQFFGSLMPLYQKKPTLYQKHITFEKH